MEAGQLPHGELGLRQVQALQLINLHKRGCILEQQYEGGVVVGNFGRITARGCDIDPICQIPIEPHLITIHATLRCTLASALMLGRHLKKQRVWQ